MRNKLFSVLSVLALSILLVAVAGGLVWGFLYLDKMEPSKNIVSNNKTEQVGNNDQNNNINDILGDLITDGDKPSEDNKPSEDGGEISDVFTKKEIVKGVSLFNADCYEYKNVGYDQCWITGIKDADRYYESLILPTYSPEGRKVIGIEKNAFASSQNNYCKAIKRVLIPSSYSYINSSAFEDSSIEEVVFGIVIGKTSEDGKALVYYLPTEEGTMRLYKDAFKNCKNLRNVEIYKSVRNIHEKAFSGCSAIETICFESEKALGQLTQDIYGSGTEKSVQILVENCIDASENEVLNYRFMLDKETKKVKNDIFNVYNSKGLFYTIIVDANGGSTTQTLYEVGANETFTFEPCKKEHYLFSGFTLSDGTNVGQTIYKGQIKENQTIVARYSPILYDIRYDLDGGVNNADNIAYISVEFKGADGSGNFYLQKATKEGYRFIGWYKDAKMTRWTSFISFNDLQEDPNTGKLCIKLYAKFEKLNTNNSIIEKN